MTCFEPNEREKLIGHITKYAYQILDRADFIDTTKSRQ